MSRPRRTSVSGAPRGNRVAALVAIALLGAVAGCGSGDPEPRGEVDVWVTLSRQGPPGPNLDHVPQHGMRVTATDRTGRVFAATTDANGTARLTIPPGTYAVDATGCPDRPRRLTVASGRTTRTEFDCLAA